jgi:hypothetical protein
MYCAWRPQAARKRKAVAISAEERVVTNVKTALEQYNECTADVYMLATEYDDMI